MQEKNIESSAVEVLEKNISIISGIFCASKCIRQLLKINSILFLGTGQKKPNFAKLA